MRTEKNPLKGCLKISDGQMIIWGLSESRFDYLGVCENCLTLAPPFQMSRSPPENEYFQNNFALEQDYLPPSTSKTCNMYRSTMININKGL